MREVDAVRNRIAVRRLNRNELFAFAQLDFAPDAHVASRPALLPDAGPLDHLHEWTCAAIEDWQLQVVQLDDCVIDARSDEGRQQVLGGGDEHSLLHQARGVAYARNVASGGFYLEVIQVGAAKDNA